MQNCLFLAQIAHTAIWTSSWKLYFASAARAAARLRSRWARHGSLAGRRIAVASFGTLTGRRRGSLVGGAVTILPCCSAAGAGATGACVGAGGAGAVAQMWFEYAYRKHDPVFQWLPTKLPEWIANNVQDKLGYPDKADPTT